ncbi:QA-SNARE protein [Perkinsela sp. CCAP 1560/4]|nr:QA-SNARE protein [Perkinsela sp. CCAP 1560/4]|eukprot:KNH07622.1 QA-SNARE protein [Perkinsela sp. CCAP 1560/4]
MSKIRMSLEFAMHAQYANESHPGSFLQVDFIENPWLDSGRFSPLLLNGIYTRDKLLEKRSSCYMTCKFGNAWIQQCQMLQTLRVLPTNEIKTRVKRSTLKKSSAQIKDSYTNH